jgi:hypothetical protein
MSKIEERRRGEGEKEGREKGNAPETQQPLSATRGS